MQTEAELNRLEANWEQKKWEEEYEAYCEEQEEGEEDDVDDEEGDFDTDKYLKEIY